MARRDLACYRVPMMLGTRSIAPVITAYSAAEARERAAVIGDDLVHRRLPWLMEGGRTKPPRGTAVGVEIGEPMRLHEGRRHL